MSLIKSELKPVVSATGTNASQDTERGCRMFKIHHLYQLVFDVIKLEKKNIESKRWEHLNADCHPNLAGGSLQPQAQFNILLL